MGFFYWSSDWDSQCSLKDNCDTHLYLCDIWGIFFYADRPHHLVSLPLHPFCTEQMYW